MLKFHIVSFFNDLFKSHLNDNTEAKCTIICPVYNKAQYISKALDSILNQKTKFKYKIIIIDDKSTDNSVEFIKKYVSKYPDIFEFYQNEENMRTLATSIRGYELIKTPYYTVLDPDDCWINENHLEQAINFLMSHKKFTLYATNTLLNKNGKTEVFRKIKDKTKIINLKKEYMYSHTSSTFFVNTYTAETIEKLKEQIGTKNERSFEGDSFRNVEALCHGLGYFHNECNSIYNFNQKGIWSQLKEIDAILINVRLYLDMYKFYGKKCQIFIRTFNKQIEYLMSIQLTKQQRYEILNIYKEYLELINKQSKLSKYQYTKNIAFFMPSRCFGGYENSFMRMAIHLANKTFFNIYYVDYKDGTVMQNLSQCNIKKIIYDDNSTFSLPKDTTIITPITLAYQIPLKNVMQTKILFWWAHPLSFRWLVGRSQRTPAFLKYFIKKAVKSDAIFFQDIINKNSCCNIINRTSKNNYLPSFIEIPNNVFFRSSIKNKEEINIGWIGRLDKDKIFSLLNILKQFNEFKTDKKKIIHIIGLGSCKDYISLDEYKSLEIRFVGKKVNKELDNYIIQNIDIVFAMGVSLLEAAKLKIPTVLVRLFEKKAYEDKFVWLFNLNNFIVGCNNYSEIEKVKTNSFSEIIDDIYNKNLFCQNGAISYNYVKVNYDIHYVSNLLLLNISRSNMKFCLYKYLNINFYFNGLLNLLKKLGKK